jgi:Zn-dependent M28 family amino/carboxypeptidase
MSRRIPTSKRAVVPTRSVPENKRGTPTIATLIFLVVVVGAVAGCLFTLVQPFVKPTPSTPPAVDPARLEAHVRRLSVDFHPRRYDQPENIARTVQYIGDELKASGAAVSTQDIAVGGRPYQNVIARFGPATGPLLVIGAHYDSYDVTPGADDNASAVAGLLELARLLGQSPPARPLELVAYAFEEQPRAGNADMGSAWHARSLRAANREVRLMLSLEMIGFFTDEPGSQRFPAPGLSLLYPDRGDFIALVGKLGDFGLTRRVKSAMSGATTLPVHSLNSPRRVPGIENSDHVNFWDAGYPALMVTDTAYLRNPNYHKASDTWQTLDFQRMAEVVRAVYAITRDRW